MNRAIQGFFQEVKVGPQSHRQFLQALVVFPWGQRPAFKRPIDRNASVLMGGIGIAVGIHAFVAYGDFHLAKSRQNIGFGNNEFIDAAESSCIMQGR